MKDFLAAYLDIRLDATLTDAIVDLIATGADVAVRIGALTDSTLVARKLAPHRRIVVASPDYLAGRSPPRFPEERRDHHCLLFALQPSGGWYYRPLDQAGERPLEVAVTGPFGPTIQRRCAMRRCPASA